MKKRNILFIHLLLLSTLLAAQQPQSYIFQLWGGGKWSATWETQLKYNANQYLVSDTTRFWDESQNDWIFTARTFYLNDSIGTLVNRIGESWNAS